MDFFPKINDNPIKGRKSHDFIIKIMDKIFSVYYSCWVNIISDSY